MQSSWQYSFRMDHACSEISWTSPSYNWKDILVEINMEHIETLFEWFLSDSSRVLPDVLKYFAVCPRVSNFLKDLRENFNGISE